MPGIKGDGVSQVFDLEGKLLATNKPTPPPGEGEISAQRIAVRGAPDWGFSYACPFTFADDRMLVRAQDCLYCLGLK